MDHRGVLERCAGLYKARDSPAHFVRHFVASKYIVINGVYSVYSVVDSVLFCRVWDSDNVAERKRRVASVCTSDARVGFFSNPRVPLL